VRAARHLAFVVGKAHGRQRWTIGPGPTGWRCSTPTGAAPSTRLWLWESVVSLAGRHEAGYLDHCRHYALAA
jgi:uncharacterized protein (DUF2252 family)